MSLRSNTKLNLYKLGSEWKKHSQNPGTSYSFNQWTFMSPEELSYRSEGFLDGLMQQRAVRAVGLDND